MMMRILSGIACLGLAWTLPTACSPELAAQDPPPQAVNPPADSPEAVALRNTHRFEKAFLVRACQLTDEQKLAADKLDDHWRDLLPKPGEEVARQIARAGVGIVQGPARINVLRIQNQVNTVNTLTAKYRKSIQSKFQELLTPEQSKIYAEELAARDQFKQQANVAVLVALLSDALGLRPEQRESLAQSLAEWPGKDNLYVAYYMQVEGTLPVIPDSLLIKHLDPEQLLIYREARKADMRTDNVQPFAAQEAFGD